MNYHARTTDKITPEEIAHSDTVRKLAGECVVILENDGTLPIDHPGKVALYGNGARHTIKGGTGSGDVNSRYVVNIDEGLKEAGFEIVTGAWLDRYDAIAKKNIDDYMTEVRRRCAETGYNEITVMLEYAPSIPPLPVLNPNDDDADTAIYVLSRDSGEGYDRKADKGDFFLTDDEETAFETITSSYARSILVLNVGGIISLGKYAKKFSSVVLLSQLGNLTGNICADVITGKSDPCGRLTDTWDSDYYNYPNSETFSLNNGNTDDEYYTEGPYIGYRYYEAAGKDVVFPFGYGLSYTTFEYSDLTVSADSIKDTDTLTVSFKVKNTGDRDGAEVTQLYVADKESTIFRPVKELRAFKKVFIKAGEEAEVTFELDKRAFAFFNVNTNDWFVESGEFDILVGASSADIKLCKTVTVEGTVEAEIPDYRATAPNYYNNVAGITRDDFAAVYGELPNPEIDKSKKIDKYCCLNDARHTKWGGRLCRLIEKIMGGMGSDANGDGKMLAAMATQIPIRNFVAMSMGAFSEKQAEGLLKMLNDDESSFVGFSIIFWRLGGTIGRLPKLLKSI